MVTKHRCFDVSDSVQDMSNMRKSFKGIINGETEVGFRDDCQCFLY